MAILGCDYIHKIGEMVNKGQQQKVKEIEQFVQ